MNDLNVVIPAPTTHDIHTPLRKQFGETFIYVLSRRGTINLSRWGEVWTEIEENVKSLPNINDKYYLLVSGMCFLNILAYISLVNYFGEAGLLVFDVQRKRYKKIEEV